MEAKELTLWFPADVKPVHVGVYEIESRMFPKSTWHSYWDGERWNWMHNYGVDSAFELPGNPTNADDPRWRGLASPAE